MAAQIMCGNMTQVPYQEDSIQHSCNPIVHQRLSINDSCQLLTGMHLKVRQCLQSQSDIGKSRLYKLQTANSGSLNEAKTWLVLLPAVCMLKMKSLSTEGCPNEADIRPDICSHGGDCMANCQRLDRYVVCRNANAMQQALLKACLP